MVLLKKHPSFPSLQCANGEKCSFESSNEAQGWLERMVRLQTAPCWHPAMSGLEGSRSREALNISHQPAVHHSAQRTRVHKQARLNAEHQARWITEFTKFCTV